MPSASHRQAQYRRQDQTSQPWQSQSQSPHCCTGISHKTPCLKLQTPFLTRTMLSKESLVWLPRLKSGGGTLWHRRISSSSTFIHGQFKLHIKYGVRTSVSPSTDCPEHVSGDLMLHLPPVGHGFGSAKATSFLPYLPIKPELSINFGHPLCGGSTYEILGSHVALGVLCCELGTYSSSWSWCKCTARFAR